MNRTPPENQAIADFDFTIADGAEAEIQAAADARAAAPGGDPLEGLAARTKENLEAAFDSAVLAAAARLEVETPQAWVRLKREMTTALKDAGSSLKEWERAIVLHRRARRDDEKQPRKRARPSGPVDDESALPLERTNTGNVRATLDNLVTIIEHHPRYRGRLWLNAMNDEPMIDTRATSDADYIDARVWLSRADTFAVSFAPRDVAAAFEHVARQRSVHPVQAFLNAQQWDGARRLDSLCARALGNDGELEGLMVRKWMVSAVARAMAPGCKVDTMLVLQSCEQGMFKSSFFAELGGEWFTDSVHTRNGLDKDALLTAHHHWICELAEFDGMTRKSDTEHLKAVLSCRADDIRKPYAMKPSKLRRGFVFCGTVNSDSFLRDDTGSRRFWIVPVKRMIDIELVRAERAQLWAEAVAAYRAGEPWYFDYGLAERIEAAQLAFTDFDSREEKLANWLRGPGANGDVTTRRALVEGLDYKDHQIDRKAETAVGLMLRGLGWVAVRPAGKGPRVRAYCPGPAWFEGRTRELDRD